MTGKAWSLRIELKRPAALAGFTVDDDGEVVFNGVERLSPLLPVHVLPDMGDYDANHDRIAEEFGDVGGGASAYPARRQGPAPC